jgi:transcriptional regulator with PAS, ATPase and Fis domain
LFREDLYYRLNVLNIEVPPLREGHDDVLLLIDYFLDKYASDLGRQKPVIQDDALGRLTAYNWPGNVRELENLIQRLVIITDEKCN